MNDLELLRRYLRDGSQDAFTQVVERHAGLVYSTARRMVSDSHLAEDVTQQVFAVLARKAHALRSGTILSGWLYRAARNVASETLRRERRRQGREQIAAEVMNDSGSDTAWDSIKNLLDDAMAGLRASDHDALVLRYFENKSLQEVGEAFGWSEGAAQKRVARALNRLHSRLVRRGASVPLTALGAAITCGAVQSAPVGLVGSAGSAALISAGALRLVPHSVFYMSTAKVKLLSTAAVIATLSVAVVIVCRENAALRRQLASLRSSVAESAGRRAAQSEPNEVSDSKDALRRFRLEHLELLSLRGRLTQLTAELRQRNPSGEHTNTVAEVKSEDADSILFSAALTNRVPNGSTLVIGGWSKEGMRGYLLATPVIQQQAGNEQRVAVQTQVIGAPESFWQQIGWGTYKSDTRRSTLAGVLAPEQIDALLEAVRETPEGDTSNSSSVTNRDGERMACSWSMDDDHGAGLLLNIELYPQITSDGKGVELALHPTEVSADRIHSSLKGRR